MSVSSPSHRESLRYNPICRNGLNTLAICRSVLARRRINNSHVRSLWHAVDLRYSRVLAWMSALAGVAGWSVVAEGKKGLREAPFRFFLAPRNNWISLVALLPTTFITQLEKPLSHFSALYAAPFESFLLLLLLFLSFFLSFWPFLCLLRPLAWKPLTRSSYSFFF